MTATTTTVRCQGCKASCNARYLDQAGYCAKSGCQKKSKGNTPSTPPVQAPATAPKATLDAQHIGAVQYDAQQSEAQQLRARCRELGVSDSGTVDVLRARLNGAKPSNPAPAPASKPAPVQSQGNVNRPTAAPAPQQGKVTEPVQGPQGTAQCYTHQQTQAGLLYAVATTGQLVEALMARCQTVADLDTVLDLVEQAAVARTAQLETKAERKAECGFCGKSVPVASLVNATCPKCMANGSPHVQPAPAPQSKPAAERGHTGTTPADREAVRGTPVQPAPQLATAAKTTPPVDTVKHAAKPQTKPAPKATKLPGSYKDLVSLGGDGVKGLAKQLGVSTDGKWAKLCSRVWQAVQDARAKASHEAIRNADLGNGRPAPKTTVDVKRTTDPVVPGCFGADGKPLTLTQVMAAVAKVQPVK